jgi:hypothetical protein
MTHSLSPWAGLLLVTLMTAGAAAAQPSQSPPPAPAPQPLSSWDLSVQDRARPPTGSEPAEPVVFGGWTFGGGGRWAQGDRLPWDADRAHPVMRSSGLTPSLAALGPWWAFAVRGSRAGPAGVTMFFKAGATSGGRATPGAETTTGDRLFAAPLERLDPAARQTVWHAGMYFERAFALGAADLTIFGEALLEGGSTPSGCSTRPDRCGAKSTVPVRVTTGVKVGF